MKPNNEKGGNKSMYKKSKRFLAGFLALLLTVTMLPTDMLSVVYAEEDESVVANVDVDTDANDNAEEALDAKVDDAEKDLEVTDADDAEEYLDEDDDLKAADTPATDIEESKESEDEEETTEADTAKEETTEKETDNQTTVTISDVLDIGALIKDGTLTAKTYETNKGTDVLDQTIGRFTLKSGGAKYTIDGSGVSPSEGDAAGMTFTGRIKTEGSGSTTSRVISFNAAVGETIVVYFQTGSGTDPRVLNLSNGSSVVKSETNGASGVPTKLAYTVQSAGTYYLYGGANIQIFYVSVSTEIEATSISDAKVTLSTSNSQWDADDAETWKAEYTGEDIKPTVKVTLDNNGETTTLTGSDYDITYARGTGDDGTTAPNDDAYESDINFTNAGTIFVKVTGKGRYENSPAVVSYTIEQAELAETKATYAVNTTGASGTTIEGSIDIKELFDIKSEEVTFGDITITNEEAQNVLAEESDVTIQNGQLKFTSVTGITEGENLTPAVITIETDFVNYSTAELTITITLVEKTKLTIEYNNSLTKEYDGEAVAFDPEDIVLYENGEAVSGSAISVDYTFSEKDGSDLVDVPVYPGEYVLTISIPETNVDYSGKTEVSFEIKKKVLELKASNRIYVKGYRNTPETTAPGNTLYYNYKELNEAVVNMTLAELLNDVDIKMTYTLDGSPVTDWSAVADNSKVVIEPEMVIKSSDTNVAETPLDNYEVKTVNGELTVLAEETPLGDNEHELNLTKDWTPGSGSWTYKDTKANTDGYFTIDADVKSAGTGNSRPLVVYDRYTYVAKVASQKYVKFTPATTGAKVEVLMAIQVGTSVKVGTATISVAADGTVSATGATVTELEGTVVYPTKDEPVHKMVKAEVTLANASECTIERGSGEFQLHYVKVTESAGGSTGDEITITPTVTGLSSGAKIAFKSADNTIVTLEGTTVVLKPSTTYEVIVLDADGSVSDTLIAKVGDTDSNVYTTGTADGTVIIAVEEKTSEPPVDDTPVKLTASRPSGSSLDSGDTVVLESEEGAEIYYIKSNDAIAGDPSSSDTHYDGPIPITENTYIKAIAIKDDKSSEVLELYYHVLSENESHTPDASMPSGTTVEKGTEITLSAVSGAAIYYTTDDSEPKAESNYLYENPIVINETTTIKAFAVEEGKQASATVEFIYIVEPEQTPPEDPTPETTIVKWEDCEITVPDILQNKKTTESTTYVTYKYTVKYADGETENKSVKFAEGVDYTVEWNGLVENTDNTYKVTLTGLGREADGRSVDGYAIEKTTKEVTYRVIPTPAKGSDVTVVDISKAKIKLDASAKTAVYTGYAIEPKADFSADKTGLEAKIGGRLRYTYKNNINVGKATVTISVGPAETEAEQADATLYVGSKTLTFNIKKAALNANAAKATAAVNCEVDTNSYTGTPSMLKVTTSMGKELTAGTDYTVTSKINAKKAETTITVKGMGSNLSGSWKNTYKIAPLDVSTLTIDPAAQTVVYSPKGGKLTQLIAAKESTTYTLTEGVDYTAKYTYADKTKAAGSTVTVTITGKNGCTGKATVSGINISKASFTSCIKVPEDIVVDSSSKKTPGEDLKKAVTVTDIAGVKFKVDKDYTLAVDTDTKKITITPKDTTNYEETGLTVSYRTATNLAKDKAFVFKNSKAELFYDGRNPVEITQAVINENISDTYKLGVNIEIVPGTYKNNAKKGTGSVTVRGKAGVDGGFYGTKVLKFKIAEK